MKKIILASDNAHKLEEFRRYFREAEIPAEIIPLRESGFFGEIVG